MRPSLERTEPYCLVCRAGLGEWYGTSVRCPSCSEINLRIDQETYWTLEPRAVRTERALKFSGTLAIVVATWALMLEETTPMEEGWKIFALMGALIPIGLWWDISSLRTRRESRLHCEVLVPAAAMVLTAAPLCWWAFHVLWRQTPDLGVAMVESLSLLLFVQPFVLAGWIIVTWMGRLRRRALSAPPRRIEPGAQTKDRSPSRKQPGPVSLLAVHEVRAAQGLLDSRPSTSYDRPTAPATETYCLHCFAPIAPIAAISTRCADCGRTTRKIDQSTYWTRSERFLRLERGLKIAASLVALATMVAAYSRAAEIGAAYVWGLPFCAFLILVALFVAWDLIGMITRRRSLLRLKSLFPVVIACLFLQITVFLRLLSEGTGGPGIQPDSSGENSIWWLIGPPLYAGIMAWFFMRWFLRWRQSAIERDLRLGRERTAAPLA